ncbi:MAG TPA: RNA polymerase sigma factor [Pirellulaceae bacterium]|nr:RNA polymerase sigma factor [Pirellulaceae bacterium]
MATVSGGPSREEFAYRWVREHAAAVRGYLLGLVRRPEVADDLAQEVFRRAWQAHDRYQDRGRQRAYLLTIADRLACDRARRLGVEVTVDGDAWRTIEPAESDRPLDQLTERESEEELAQALEQLSPVQRRVLLLRYYGEMEFAEIAAAIGCPLSTALSHCRRGLLALRKLLAEQNA